MLIQKIQEQKQKNSIEKKKLLLISGNDDSLKIFVITSFYSIIFFMIYYGFFGESELIFIPKFCSILCFVWGMNKMYINTQKKMIANDKIKEIKDSEIKISEHLDELEKEIELIKDDLKSYNVSEELVISILEKIKLSKVPKEKIDRLLNECRNTKSNVKVKISS